MRVGRSASVRGLGATSGRLELAQPTFDTLNPRAGGRRTWRRPTTLRVIDWNTTGRRARGLAGGPGARGRQRATAARAKAIAGEHASVPDLAALGSRPHPERLVLRGIRRHRREQAVGAAPTLERARPHVALAERVLRLGGHDHPRLLLELAVELPGSPARVAGVYAQPAAATRWPTRGRASQPAHTWRRPRTTSVELAERDNGRRATPGPRCAPARRRRPARRAAERRPRRASPTPG